jgi:tetratricopeptide (TPR) repeat protein
MLAGRCDEAGPFLERAYRIAQEITGANPAVDGFRSKLAAIANDLGWWMREKGRLDEAADIQDQALVIQGAIARNNPGVPGFRWTLANIHREIGWIHRQRGEPEEARGAFNRALAIDEKLPRSYADRYCELARDYALCIPLAGGAKAEGQWTPDERAERSRLADAAMAALKRAVEGGFLNADRIENDPDLEPLRPREDFRSLLESIRAGNESDPTPSLASKG